MHSYTPADLAAARTYAAGERPTKVKAGDLAALTEANPRLDAFFDALPNVLKAADLRAVVASLVEARQRGKPVILGIGGHVVKCGLNPLLIHCIEQGVITAVAMNGSVGIHDFELATLGSTSEDVAASLESGMFGMVSETGTAMNDAIMEGRRQGIGMAEAIGRKIRDMGAPNTQHSLLACGVRCGIPMTMHVAIGGDTIHMHAEADGAALGETSFTDFRLLVSVLRDIGDGGVYLNIGSAVVLPEVFLKALNLARNLSETPIENFTTVNMDMTQHYRPLENVVRRPVQKATGHGYSLTGHHEIMVPLVLQLVLAGLDKSSPAPVSPHD